MNEFQLTKLFLIFNTCGTHTWYASAGGGGRSGVVTSCTDGGGAGKSRSILPKSKSVFFSPIFTVIWRGSA